MLRELSKGLGYGSGAQILPYLGSARTALSPAQQEGRVDISKFTQHINSPPRVIKVNL